MSSLTFRLVATYMANKFKIPQETIFETSHCVDDLYMDSIDLIELLMYAEDEYKIEISDEEAENIQTVGDLVNIIELKEHEKLHAPCSHCGRK